VEQLDSYYVRFWKRFSKDATPWARDNIIWGVIVLVAPSALPAYYIDSCTLIGNWFIPLFCFMRSPL
jgi:hypothetical protein